MKSFLELKEKIQKGKDDPCWKDYVQLGTKKKNGKEVPNCVPKESVVQEESAELDETITPKHVKMAVGVASDKRYAGGNMTGAVNAIEKIKKGLSDHPQVKAVLRKQNESLDEAGSPERLAIIKRATQRVKDKRDAARAAEKKASFKSAVRDMQTKGAQRGMAPLKRDIDEGHDDAQKAFMGLVKRGGIDKATFQKAHDLYSNAKFSELKKLISGADTDPREAILDVINRHDRKTFNSMYPRGLSKGGLTKESSELGEVKIPNNYAAIMAKKRKASLVKDRKTGKMYDPDKEFEKLKNSPEFKDQMKRMAKRDAVGEGVELGEATDFRAGDTVYQVGSKLKGTVQHKGNRDLIAVKFGSINQMIPASRLRLAESVELDEAFKKGDSVTVKNARKYDALSKPEVSGTVIGMNGNKVMVKVGSGQMNVDARDLVKESVELGEAKISVGDRVTLQPNKNTLDRSLIGKAGVVTGMVGSKPTVKFANGKTIVASPNDLKINESVELDEATYMVTIDKGTYGGVKSDGRPILVKAKSVRDATTRAAKKVKIDPRLVPTGGFNVKVNNKESVEHENCGTPDCCSTCDTDIKEMNFFQFRNRLDSTRD